MYLKMCCNIEISEKAKELQENVSLMLQYYVIRNLENNYRNTIERKRKHFNKSLPARLWKITSMIELKEALSNGKINMDQSAVHSLMKSMLNRIKK